MTNNMLLILGIIWIFIILKMLCDTTQLEHLTNDEAVKNIASLYNQGKLSVTDFNSTGTGTFNNITATNSANLANLNATGKTNMGPLVATGNIDTNSVKIWGTKNSIQLLPDSTSAIGGDFWVGGNIYGPTIDGLNNKINNTQNSVNGLVNCNWTGDRSIFGGNGGCIDDGNFTCTNGKITSIKFNC